MGEVRCSLCGLLGTIPVHVDDLVHVEGLGIGGLSLHLCPRCLESWNDHKQYVSLLLRALACREGVIIEKAKEAVLDHLLRQPEAKEGEPHETPG